MAGRCDSAFRSLAAVMTDRRERGPCHDFSWTLPDPVQRPGPRPSSPTLGPGVVRQLLRCQDWSRREERWSQLAAEAVGELGEALKMASARPCPNRLLRHLPATAIRKLRHIAQETPFKSRTRDGSRNIRRRSL